MAFEDFTTYDETDEGSTVTVTSSKVSFTSLTRDEEAHVSDSKGTAHFNGDFTHQFECEVTASSGFNVTTFWGLANVQADLKTIIDASGDAIVFNAQVTVPQFYLQIVENGTPNSNNSVNLTKGTRYYVTITRDDDGGVNNTGRVIAFIRTGSHGGALFDTLLVDCGVGEQNDFEYVYGLMSFDDGVGGITMDGYTENLDLNEAVGGLPIPVAMNHLKNQGVA